MASLLDEAVNVAWSLWQHARGYENEEKALKTFARRAHGHTAEERQAALEKAKALLDTAIELAKGVSPKPGEPYITSAVQTEIRDVLKERFPEFSTEACFATATSGVLAVWK